MIGRYILVMIKSHGQQGESQISSTSFKSIYSQNLKAGFVGTSSPTPCLIQEIQN